MEVFSENFKCNFSRIISVIALTVVVAVSLMVIPAFAAESYVFSRSENAYFGEARLPEGTYIIKCIVVDDVTGNVGEIQIPTPITVAYVIVNEDDLTFEFCEVNSTFVVGDTESQMFLQIASGSDVGNACTLTLDGINASAHGITAIEFIPYSEPAVPFVDRIGGVLGTVVGWINSLISSLVSPDGALHDLLPLMAVAISVSVLLIGVKVVRYFIDIRGS